MATSYYEFKMVQDDGVEIVMKVGSGDAAFPQIVDNLRSFFLACGFHTSTLDKHLGAEDE